MAFTEKVSVSGTALSYLLKECLSSPNKQEGFLFGNVTKLVTNHISDSRSDNARVDVMINVTAMLPAPETGMFYTPAGRVKEDVLEGMLEGVTNDVVGWYHYRQISSLKPTMRDRVVSRSLQKYLSKNGFRYFLCCNITNRQTVTSATHVYSYRFYKVSSGGELEYVTDVTSNLGESVSGYKASTGDRNDPFNRAVLETTVDGVSITQPGSIHGLVKHTLEKAAADAAEWEATARVVSADINCMIDMLANHHQTRRARGQRSTSRQEERAVIQPLVVALSTAPIRQAEPFDFVTDIIRNNLKQGDPGGSGSPSAEKETEGASFSAGHKRICSEGALQSPSTLDKGKPPNPRRWEQSPTQKGEHNHVPNP